MTSAYPQAATLRGIVFDVDGVLTDGRIIYGDNGTEWKAFHVQDGASIKQLAKHDVAIAIITGRKSTLVERRATELGIHYLKQGVDNKAAALDELITSGFPNSDLAAVGDDQQDLAMFDHPAVTLSITVPNAHPKVLERAHFVTERRGGEGVAVNIAELVLRAKNCWD